MENLIEQIVSEIVPVRRQLHEIPELGYQEFQTTARIAEYLKGNGLAFHRFQNLKTGGYCDVGKGDIIAFRSDIDALPINEDKNHSVRSQRAGVMHACGHDYHIAFGLALLKYFANHEEQLKYRLRVIFQPAEESVPGGAVDVLKEDIWEDVKVILTAHVNSDLAPGKVALCANTASASSATIELSFVGPGGHTSRPHETVDLISVTAMFITQINNYLHEHVDPRNPFVLVFGEIKGGSAHNIIPQDVKLRGTLRTFDNSVNRLIISLLQRYCNAFAELYGFKVNLNIPSICPVVRNDRALFNHFREFVNKNSIFDVLIENEKPSMGADDFAYFLEKAPGLYFRIGAGSKGSAHSSSFLADENLLLPGCKGFIEFIEYLNR
ncbi:MAG: M20 family metallopeptidase [Candidatus Neomarinimicrobiota bacterium]